MGRIVKIPHTQTIEKVIQASDSDIDQGLQSQEIQTRIEKYGANILDAIETVSPLSCKSSEL